MSATNSTTAIRTRAYIATTQVDRLNDTISQLQATVDQAQATTQRAEQAIQQLERLLNNDTI